jgi:hypothetical protein
MILTKALSRAALDLLPTAETAALQVEEITILLKITHDEFNDVEPRQVSSTMFAFVLNKQAILSGKLGFYRPQNPLKKQEGCSPQPVG